MTNRKIMLMSGLVIGFFVSTNVASAISFNWWSKDKPALAPAVGTTTKTVQTSPAPGLLGSKVSKIKKFNSAAEVAAYLAKAQKLSGYSFGLGDLVMMERSALVAPSSPAAKATSQTSGSGSFEGGRFSATNVQVAGIDEPDFLKIDDMGEIYFSGGERYRGGCVSPADSVVMASGAKAKIAPCLDNNYGPKTALIKASPVTEVKVDSVIEDAGQLLLHKKNLIMQTGSTLTAYDVSSPSSPTKKWSIDLSNSEGRRSTRVVDSRLANDKLYLITATNVYYEKPCPYELFKVGSQSVAISCNEIYRPATVVPANAVYTISVINPATGAVEKKTSLLAEEGNAVVYVSPKNIYVAYSYSSDETAFALKFFKENARDILPSSIINKIDKLSSLDLGRNAKNAELNDIFNQYYSSLSSDDRLAAQSNLQNRLSRYVSNHLRDLETTEITKISLSSLQPVAGGTVPGRLLNQFSLDESRDYLRVATTNNGNVWLPGNLSVNNQSESDVYILGDELDRLGVVRGLGKTERIFGVRFIGERGYVVTFRQTDPFYVLDLSNPRSPKLVGELKIPGYSGYLHPIDENRLIAVGQEDNKVKVALYDVSNSSRPVELSRYLLNDGYSEAINNHRAFLIDQKYQVFFLPGSQGGYVFAYGGNQLSLKKAIGDYSVKRAAYYGSHLYIIGDKKMVVFNEDTWDKVKELAYDVGWSAVPVMY